MLKTLHLADADCRTTCEHKDPSNSKNARGSRCVYNLVQESPSVPPSLFKKARQMAPRNPQALILARHRLNGDHQRATQRRSSLPAFASEKPEAMPWALASSSPCLASMPRQWCAHMTSCLNCQPNMCPKLPKCCDTQIFARQQCSLNPNRLQYFTWRKKYQ